MISLCALGNTGLAAVGYGHGAAQVRLRPGPGEVVHGVSVRNGDGARECGVRDQVRVALAWGGGAAPE